MSDAAALRRLRADAKAVKVVEREAKKRAQEKQAQASAAQPKQSFLQRAKSMFKKFIPSWGN